MTSTGAAPKAGPHRNLGVLGNALDRRFSRLQQEYLREESTAKVDLARLRRGLGKPAGSVPEIWELTIGSVPESLSWDRDEPSRAEQASHAAFTLFALHQQSLNVAVHEPGTSFGHAVGKLRSKSTRSPEAVTNRFMAVSTAESVDEVLVHMRGLITQLRSEREGFDYARLADDLTGLLTPARAVRVRLAWGRDFYRTSADTADSDDSGENDSADENTEE
ncbi:type I-E CRISPR-associated protein Cse2/CasB [Actinopolyspora erythraea]|uniref:CRISPR-associated protein Cse2 n=1 Tax=Actinopolyspora erythraea TaxID=414996 RepID=A0A099D4G3_9ACTN|nr:type I-E CRISPR-associated protein Cse2/CasB [Actinopolyspora erythraea]ASU77286.1 type I-E CRISPR-associated protein Cse2/CasB [Actinopolyspora erythraea]KGI80230.1 CRISPR-associated protein Cse2 [Actinopolyspora erythraea]